GAGRSRIVRQLLTEALLLFLLGGTVGITVAYAGVAVLLRLAPAELAQLQDTRLDFTVAVFTLIVSVAGGVIFGLLSDLQAWHHAVCSFSAGLPDSLRQPPVVTSASAVSNFFLDRLPGSSSFSIEGRPERVTLPLTTDVVTPEFFSTMGIRLLRGRFFDAHDR